MDPIGRLGVVALDCPDPDGLAAFYSAITGWPVRTVEDDWVEIGVSGQVGLAFQLAPNHVAPDWPGGDRPQQAHLDIEVDDLDVAEGRVLALGAVKADVQPDPSWRVFLDPAGHPFCLVPEQEDRTAPVP
jgi:catechol 2,3-dioxygenase-like lactoylglutathione lyase family enzyme